MSGFQLLHRLSRLTVAFGVCLAAVVSIGTAGSPATAAASSLYSVPGNALPIPAGGTGYLQVRGLALQPGANVPSSALTIAAQQLQAGDRIRTALYYGIDWGYGDTAPDQVAQAVWWTQDNTWRSTDHATAERIGTAAVNAQGIPSWNPDGRNLLTVIAQGQAIVSGLTLTQLQQTAYAGNGTLAVQNNSGSDMTVYLPYGTLFTGASGTALVWATGVGGQPAQVTPTSQTAGQPSATATVAAPATSTPLPAQPSATPITPKGGGQPPAPPTATAEATSAPLPSVQVKGASATPSMAPPSVTPVPPAPTDTPRPTDTPQATSTPVPVDTQTPLPQPTATPQAVHQDGQQSAPQLPPSQPAQPVQHKGDNQQAPAPTGTGGVAASKDEPSGNVSAQAAAPLPFSPTPGRTSTPTAVSSNPGQAAPPPIGTTQSQTGLPQPVDTSVAKATAPFPISTVNGTVTGGQATKPPVLPPAPVPSVSGPLPTVSVAAPVVDTPTSAVTSQDQKPAPTPAPQPSGNPGTTGTGKTPEPVIVVGPGGSTDGSPSGAGNSNPSTSGNGVPPGNTQGSPPKVNPVTGAGPSGMPLWFAAIALVMVIGGWTLRRAGRPAEAGQTP